MKIGVVDILISLAAGVVSGGVVSLFVGRYLTAKLLEETVVSKIEDMVAERMKSAVAPGAREKEKCPSCGILLLEDAIFCHMCGTKIRKKPK